MVRSGADKIRLLHAVQLFARTLYAKIAHYLRRKLT